MRMQPGSASAPPAPSPAQEERPSLRPLHARACPGGVRREQRHLKALGSDKKIVEATTPSASGHIYASVETVGTADKARLEAKWTFTGSGPVSVNVIHGTGEPRGPSVNEFHITKKTDY